MSTEGYQQAIENVAFEIDLLSEEAEQFEGGDPLAGAVLIMSGANPEFRERTRKIDHIITVICSTYHRTEAQVDEDIDAAIKQRVREYS